MKTLGLEQDFYVRSFLPEANIGSKIHTGNSKIWKCFKFLSSLVSVKISLGENSEDLGVLFNILTV